MVDRICSWKWIWINMIVGEKSILLLSLIKFGTMYGGGWGWEREGGLDWTSAISNSIPFTLCLAFIDGRNVIIRSAALQGGVTVNSSHSIVEKYLFWCFGN